MRLVQISILCFASPLSVKEKINIELANQKQEAMSFLESDWPINSFPSLTMDLQSTIQQIAVASKT